MKANIDARPRSLRLLSKLSELKGSATKHRLTNLWRTRSDLYVGATRKKEKGLSKRIVIIPLRCWS